MPTATKRGAYLRTCF